MDSFVGGEVDVAQGPYLTPGIDTSRQPLYTVGEVAKFFYCRKADWLRWRERKGDITINRRSDNGSRVYTLSDIEAMTFLLARKGAITPTEAMAAQIIIAAQLISWQYHCLHHLPLGSCPRCQDGPIVEVVED